MDIWEKKRDEIRWAQALNLANETVSRVWALPGNIDRTYNHEELALLKEFREMFYELLCEPSPTEKNPGGNVGLNI